MKLGLRIIRIHSLDGEKRLFEDKLNPRAKSENFRTTEKHISTFQYLTQSKLNEQGAKSDADRKRGDKRRDPRLKNLSLSEAMWEELEAERETNFDYLKLSGYLLELKDNPESLDVSKAELDRLVTLLQHNTRAKADIEIATVAGALRPAFRANRQDRHYAIITVDEAAKSVPQYFHAIVGFYAPSLFYMMLGDCNQSLPFQMSVQALDYINSKYKTSRYSALQRLKDGGHPIFTVYVQFRMFTETFFPHVSAHWYNGQMEDGTRAFPEPVEVAFSRDFNKKKFGINDNWVIVKTSGSFSKKEDSGTSMANLAHEILAMEYCGDLRDHLNDTELKFDKSKFTTKYIAPYKAQVNNMKNRLIEFDDRRFSALTGKVIQGVEGSAVILDFPNGKSWTEFVNDSRDVLVEVTRHRYLLIIIMSASCLVPANYQLDSHYRLLQSPKAKNILALYDYAAQRGNVFEVQAPDTRPCKKCKEVGHLAADCNAANACWNCGSHNHVGENCPEIKVHRKPIASFTSTCRKC
jgi:hypothetical protein